MIIVALAAMILSACGSSPLANRSGAQTATPVTTPVVGIKRIVAEGRLLPVESVDLSFQASGRVDELFIAEGSVVEEGQVLARLSGAEQLQMAVEAATYELLAATQEIDTLHENYGRALADAEYQLAQAKIDLEDAEEDRTRMVYRRASEATLNGLRADVIMAEETLEDAQDAYDHVAGGKDNVAIAQALSYLSAAQKAYDRAEYNLIYASELPDQNEIDKAEANLRLAKARVETARLSLERLSGGPDSRALALAEARKQKAEADLQASQKNLENLELKAPFSGTIVDLNIAMGEQAGPGLVAASLADYSTWIVETTDLTEINVAEVRVGQPATLVADALPDVEFTGKVERISNVYQEKQGDITYTVRIALDGSDDRLRWGMTFMVSLPTGEEGEPVGQVQQPTAVPAAPAEEKTPETPALPVSAEDVVTRYFASLENTDPRDAVQWLSNFSMVAERTNREAVAGALQAHMAEGARWSELEVKESQALDDTTTLVHVLYQFSTTDAQTGDITNAQKDEWWAVRFENGQWLYNWNNVIDFRTLDIAAQSTGGLTINPSQISRYPDRLDLVMFVQNRTNETIVLGQTNEILAIFYFGGETREAEKAQLVFARQQTYPEVRIQVKGDQLDYPDRVVIRKWKNYDTAPWYDFNLAAGQ